MSTFLVTLTTTGDISIFHYFLLEGKIERNHKESTRRHFRPSRRMTERVEGWGDEDHEVVENSTCQENTIQEDEEEEKGIVGVKLLEPEFS